MCVRINNISQLAELRKYFYEKYNSVIQKQYAYLLKIKSKQTSSLFQQFKIELYKIKVLNKTVEFKLDKLASGLTNLLVFRVKFFFNLSEDPVISFQDYQIIFCRF